MKKNLLFVILLIICFKGYAAHGDKTGDLDKTPQVVYIELGNTGTIGSISYDRHISRKPGGFGFRAGYATNFSKISGVPVVFYYLLGNRKRFFEVGLGETFLAAKKEPATPGVDYPEDYEIQPVVLFSMNDLPPGKNEFLSCFTVGYRVQPPGWGFCFRTGYTGYITNKNTGGGNFYLSLGVAF